MKLFQFAIKCILTFVVLIVSLIALFLSGSYFDEAGVEANARRSAALLCEEGDYYRPVKHAALLQRDNFTDALMISSTISKPKEISEWESMLYSPVYSLIDSTSMTHSCDSIARITSGREQFTESYARYWHGYKVMLRPMLSITNIRGIRIVNLILCLVLFGIAAWLIYTKVGRNICVVFALSMLLTGFPIITFSMQFVACYAISLIGIIIIGLMPQKKLDGFEPMYLLFIVLGGLTSFFDLLTAPLMTFGLPAVVALLRRNRLPDWKFLIGCGVMWAFGYAGIWSLKWLLTYEFLSDEIVASVMEAIECRSGSISLTDFGRKGILLCIILAAFLILVLWGVRAALQKRGTSIVKRYLSLIFLGLLPIIWILVMQNHSFMHYWFVWRIFSVSIFSLGTFYVKISE